MMTQMIKIHASISLLVLLLVPAGILAQSVDGRSSGQFSDSALQIDSGITSSRLPGINIAQVTLTHRDSTDIMSTKRFSVSASLAVAPILGVSLARRITGGTRESARFLPSLLGAYISTAVTTLGLALLQPLEHGKMESDTPNDGTLGILADQRITALNILIQLALPSLVPGANAAAMQTLRQFHLSKMVEIDVLTPALFRSPVNERQFLLGINLIAGKF
jgi:hypothetical protein